jgi:uncharacterized membrane protein
MSRLGGILASSAFLAARTLIFLTMSCIAAVFLYGVLLAFEDAFAEGRDNRSEVYIIVAMPLLLVGIFSLIIALWTASSIRIETFWIGMCFVAVALVFPPYAMLFGEWAAALHGGFVGIAVVSAVMWYGTSKNMRNRIE